MALTRLLQIQSPIFKGFQGLTRDKRDNIIMKTYVKLALVSGALLSLHGCSGCSDNSTTIQNPNVIELPSETEITDTVISGSVLNKQTKTILTDVAITLSFFDENLQPISVRDITGTEISSLMLEQSEFGLLLPSMASYSKFIIVASAPGYVENRFDFDVASFTQQQTIVLSLAPEIATGLVKSTEPVTVTDCLVGQDTLNQTQTVSDNTSNQAGIKNQTGFLDANGDTVCPTQVNIEVVTVKSTDLVSNDVNELYVADVIPTGFAELATQVTQTLVPISIASVKVTDENGNDISRFTQPLDITMSFPEIFLPSAGRNVQVGDLVTLASFDEGDGAWEIESSDIAVSGQDTTTNTFSVTFNTDHLTQFAIFDTVATCIPTTNFVFFGATVPNTGLLLDIQTSNNLSLSKVVKGDFILLDEIGIDTDITYSVTDFNGNTWAESTATDICGTDVGINLTLPSGAVDETLTLEAVCEQDANITALRSAAFISYRIAQSGQAFLSATNNGDGTYDLPNLVLDENYEVRVIPPDAANFTQTILADNQSETIQYNVQCRVITGAS